MGSKGASSKTIVSTASESKVSGIIKSLGVLEDDLDSLNGKAGDMKKKIATTAQSQIDSLKEKTREMAAKEAEVIINESKSAADAESKKIAKQGDARLAEIATAVDQNFDDAVGDVLSTILKP